MPGAWRVGDKSRSGGEALRRAQLGSEWCGSSRFGTPLASFLVGPRRRLGREQHDFRFLDLRLTRPPQVSQPAEERAFPPRVCAPVEIVLSGRHPAHRSLLIRNNRCGIIARRPVRGNAGPRAARPTRSAIAEHPGQPALRLPPPRRPPQAMSSARHLSGTGGELGHVEHNQTYAGRAVTPRASVRTARGSAAAPARIRGSSARSPSRRSG
jgi:hypothetical protein